MVLSRAGGFAGQTETVTVEPDGRWTVTGSAVRGSGRLTPAQLARLNSLAADPRLAAEASRPPTSTVCRDAYDYRLTIGATETRYTDCLADPDRPPVTRAAVELLTAATGAGPQSHTGG
ncbi:hypothetical protein [Micromonospora sp. DT47]|uniref:hypothetical protein n=1 Tax=Micromonospora sp. DT47 TaxID=3393431 RepID=UPI003CEAEBA9